MRALFKMCCFPLGLIATKLINSHFVDRGNWDNITGFCIILFNAPFYHAESFINTVSLSCLMSESSESSEIWHMHFRKLRSRQYLCVHRAQYSSKMRKSVKKYKVVTCVGKDQRAHKTGWRAGDDGLFGFGGIYVFHIEKFVKYRITLSQHSGYLLFLRVKQREIQWQRQAK